jgi:phosphoglycerol transferase MdoB-like AlkP superfamily enzyme
MSKTLFSLVSYYLLWIAIFFLERLVFIGHFYSKIFPISVKEFLSIFLYSLRMDASMAAYICVIPLLFYMISWFVPALKASVKLLKVYSLLILLLSALIMAVNLNIYQEWGTKLPYKAISTLIEYPYEAYISASSSPILGPFILFLIIVNIGWYILNRTLQYTIAVKQNKWLKWYSKVAVSIFLCGILFLLIRSGWQTTPLNPSMAYFSDKPILNHAAVNTEWNLLSDYLHSKGPSKNPYQYMEDTIAQERISHYLNPNSSSNSILNKDNPNVVLIILESFTSDLIKSLGGETETAPNLERLIEDGLLFSNIYSTSDRTDKGIVAIMSGFPSQATQSIIKNVNKLENLPAITQDFRLNGYNTSFIYGGESEFYNFKSFMLSHGVQQVIDQHAFPIKDVMSKWGAFDHLTFQKSIDYFNKSPQPFFSTLLTLSNHEPFDLPNPPHFGSSSLANLFRSTAYYTDSALYDFINKATETDWYKNTLFVVIADHGHRLPLEKWDNHHPNRYRIPFLLYGDVLKEDFRGKTIDKIGSQTDLANTLLNLLNINSKNYFWSRDLLDNETSSFAFFTWDDGFGVVTPEQSLSFDNVGNKIIYLENIAVQDSLNQKLKNVGQAYLQETYRQYLNY